MPHTFDEAYTIITTHLQERWAELTPSIVGTVPEIRFEDIATGEIPKATFARFVMNEVDSPRTALRNAEYGQRFENNGLIILQLLIWKQDTKDAERLRKLGQVSKDIFRDPAFPGCFIFRRIRVNRLDPEKSYLRANLYVEYQFDEIT